MNLILLVLLALFSGMLPLYLSYAPFRHRVNHASKNAYYTFLYLFSEDLMFMYNDADKEKIRKDVASKQPIFIPYDEKYDNDLEDNTSRANEYGDMYYNDKNLSDSN